jgi:hypothetical protein
MTKTTSVVVLNKLVKQKNLLGTFDRVTSKIRILYLDEFKQAIFYILNNPVMLGCRLSRLLIDTQYLSNGIIHTLPTDYASYPPPKNGCNQRWEYNVDYQINDKVARYFIAAYMKPFTEITHIFCNHPKLFLEDIRIFEKEAYRVVVSYIEFLDTRGIACPDFFTDSYKYYKKVESYEKRWRKEVIQTICMMRIPEELRSIVYSFIV